MYADSMRDLYSWEELNRAGKTQMRAGHAYVVEHPAPAGHGQAAGLKRQVVLAALAAVPVALAITLVVAAAVH